MTLGEARRAVVEAALEWYPYSNDRLSMDLETQQKADRARHKLRRAIEEYKALL